MRRAPPKSPQGGGSSRVDNAGAGGGRLDAFLRACGRECSGFDV